MPQARRAPDVVGQLREIERIAAEALRRIADGEASKGTSALTKIRTRAQDARRWADEDKAHA